MSFVPKLLKLKKYRIKYTIKLLKTLDGKKILYDLHNIIEFHAKRQKGLNSRERGLAARKLTHMGRTYQFFYHRNFVLRTEIVRFHSFKDHFTKANLSNCELLELQAQGVSPVNKVFKVPTEYRGGYTELTKLRNNYEPVIDRSWGDNIYVYQKLEWIGYKHSFFVDQDGLAKIDNKVYYMMFAGLGLYLIGENGHTGTINDLKPAILKSKTILSLKNYIKKTRVLYLKNKKTKADFFKSEAIEKKDSHIWRGVRLWENKAEPFHKAHNKKTLKELEKQKKLKSKDLEQRKNVKKKTKN